MPATASARGGDAVADPAGALVRPLAVARCDLDQPMAAMGLFPGPVPVGHETVALPDNACDAYRAVGPQLAECPGADVLIVGGAAASIGLYAVAFARAWGRRGCVTSTTITVEASGEQEGLTAALRSTEKYGFCTAVAIHFAATVPLPLLEMYTQGITFHVSRADLRRLLPIVLELFADDRFDPLAVPTTVVAWEQADEAWLQPATKLVLERQ